MFTFLRTLIGQKESHPHKVTKEYQAWDERRDETEANIKKNNGRCRHLDNNGRYLLYYAEKSLSPFLDDATFDKLKKVCPAIVTRSTSATINYQAVQETLANNARIVPPPTKK